MAEKAPDYDEFLRKWKSRLGLKDRHIAEAYMWASDRVDHPDPDGIMPKPGTVLVVLAYDDANLAAYVQPETIVPMLDDWTAELDNHEEEPREFTKTLIMQWLALRKGRDVTDATTLVIAALWLALTAPEGGGVELAKFIEQGGVGVRYDITHPSKGIRNFRLSLLMLPPDETGEA